MRRQTSQTSSSDKPSPTSPVMGPLQSAEDDEDSAEAQSPAMEQKSRSGTRSKSLHPGNVIERASAEQPEDEPSEDAGESTTKENTPPPLVDPDFRSRFADRTRPRHRSFTNLSTAAWRSTAAMPTAASYQASGFMAPEKPSRPPAEAQARQHSSTRSFLSRRRHQQVLKSWAMQKLQHPCHGRRASLRCYSKETEQQRKIRRAKDSQRANCAIRAVSYMECLNSLYAFVSCTIIACLLTCQVLHMVGAF